MTDTRYCPNPWFAIRRGVSLSWDNAGLVSALNLSWMVGLCCYGILASHFFQGISSLPGRRPRIGGLSELLVLIVGVVLIGVLTAGPGYAMACRSRLESAGLAEWLAGVRRDGLRYALLALLSVLVIGECLFYSRWLALTPGLWLLSPAALYLAFFWLLAVPYQFALVSLEDRPLLDVVKRSCLLLLDNPLYTFLTTVMMGMTILLLAVSGIGLVLACTTAALTLAQASTQEVLRKYKEKTEEDS